MRHFIFFYTDGRSTPDPEPAGSIYEKKDSLKFVIMRPICPYNFFVQFFSQKLTVSDFIIFLQITNFTNTIRITNLT